VVPATVPLKIGTAVGSMGNTRIYGFVILPNGAMPFEDLILSVIVLFKFVTFIPGSFSTIPFNNIVLVT